MVTRDEYHCEDNLSKKLNKARQQRQNFFSQCLKRQAAAVDEAECEEERDGYAEVAGAVSEDGRVGGAGDQMNHRRCKRRDKENQACSHAEAENISITDAFPHALPVVCAAVLCNVGVDGLRHGGKRHHGERKQLSRSGMSGDSFISEAVDARLQNDRTNINDAAHKSHRKSLRQQICVQSAVQREVAFFRKQDFRFRNNINQAEHNGNALCNDGCNRSTPDTHAEGADKQQIEHDVHQR